MPKDIRTLADQILRDPVVVEIGRRAPAATVSHALYPRAREQSRARCCWRCSTREATGKVLIFTRTKHRARHLAEVLDQQGHRVSALQGNMTQNRRQAAIDGFRKDRYDILVATDLAARGIDISAISHVINYDMPSTVEAYTHRIGRTGRAELTGEAFTFTTPEDEPLVRGIERVLGARIERRTAGWLRLRLDAAAAGPPARWSATATGRRAARACRWRLRSRRRAGAADAGLVRVVRRARGRALVLPAHGRKAGGAGSERAAADVWAAAVVAVSGGRMLRAGAENLRRRKWSVAQGTPNAVRRQGGRSPGNARLLFSTLLINPPRPRCHYSYR